MNASTYRNLLVEAFPEAKAIFGPKPWKFQQDNAPIHNARVVKSWIQSEDVELLTWPPYSPDLNIMENAWGRLSRKVYEGGRQFETVEDLKAGIQEAWCAISLNYLKSLYDSMKNRIFELIKKMEEVLTIKNKNLFSYSLHPCYSIFRIGF